MTRDQIFHDEAPTGPNFPSTVVQNNSIPDSLKLICVVAGTLGLAVRGRLSTASLWLDESQTVAITREPLSSLVTALEQDGHPPLFYALLKAWASIFGYGAVSLRALSGLFGLGAVVAIVFVARRVGGQRLGYVAGALALTSPFLVRYSTEIRMYSLVTLLVCSWWLAVEWTKDASRSRKSDIPGLVLVGLLSAAMAYTHYWTLFVLLAWVLSVTWRLALAKERCLQRLFVAMAVGGLPFLAWIPSLLTQVRHTGTPWSDAPNPASVLLTGVADFAGGRERGEALMLMVCLVVLGVIGFGGRSTGAHKVEIDLAGRPENRPVAWMFIGPILIATVVITVTNTAFAGRYLAIVIGFALVLVAKGLLELGSVGAGVGLVGVSVLSLVGANHGVSDVRSQGYEVADALLESGHPGDLVLVCPDQLGPTVAYYLGENWEVLSYPSLIDANRVDWTDYTQRHDDAVPSEVAAEALQRAETPQGTETPLGADEPAQVWLVWQDGYRTLGDQCAGLRDELANSSSSIEHLVMPSEDAFEPMWLTRFNR